MSASEHKDIYEKNSTMTYFILKMFCSFLILLSSHDAYGREVAPSSGFSNWSPLHIYSEEPEIQIKFGNSVCNIPRNYVISYSQANSTGSYAHFTIEILLPNFEPHTTSNSDQFSVRGHGNKLMVAVEYGISNDPPKVVIDRMLKIANLSEDKYTVTSSGFELYSISNAAEPPELYVKRKSEDNIFYFSCNTEKEVPYPSCTVNENYTNEVRLYYSFGSKYKEDAEIIDRKIKELVKLMCAGK